MDNQSHNFQEQQPDQKPQKPHNGLKQTAIVAVVAAVIGGGVGGGAAYFGLKNAAESSLGVTSTSQKAGTTQVSNVSVKESSSSTTAAAKVKNAVVSVVNLQKAQSTSSGLMIGAIILAPVIQMARRVMGQILQALIPPAGRRLAATPAGHHPVLQIPLTLRNTQKALG